ncbi:MAG: formate/nitrite transporter family protein [Oscillospiraceae bacterium]|nr:formate/nitrite transporter family protein [Oscillospiraceae bacterium]
MKNPIYAGAFISLGAVFYKATAFAPAFAAGIILCVLFADKLVTRVIPLALRKKYKFYEIFVALLGNFIGAAAVAVVAYFCGISYELRSFDLNLNDIVLLPFAAAIGCGFFISCGVFAYLRFKDKQPILAFTLLALFITAFVACGFRHVVAEAFYIALGGLNGDGFIRAVTLPAVFLGNFVGAWLSDVVVKDSFKA